MELYLVMAAEAVVIRDSLLLPTAKWTLGSPPLGVHQPPLVTIPGDAAPEQPAVPVRVHKDLVVALGYPRNRELAPSFAAHHRTVPAIAALGIGA